MIAKRQKTDRRHAFENMNLVYEQFFDLDDAFQGARRGGYTIFFQKLNRRIELVQDLFEPQFISLMHCDEEKFIVMSGSGQAVLKIDQILNTKILVVGERRIVAVSF